MHANLPSERFAPISARPSSAEKRDASGNGEVGNLLRDWRAARGKSQLDLSLEAEVSQRHLSFIESGRSVPGRDKLMDIAEALDLPLRERNALLLAAGYAPRYSEEEWGALQMKSITDAVGRMLKQQEPYPAVLMDRYWNVLAANDAAPRFFGRFVDLASRPTPRNLLHLMFDPAGMRPFIQDWEQVSISLLDRVRREAVGGVVDERGCKLLAELRAYPGDAPQRGHRATRHEMPMIPLSFAKEGRVMRYFSLVSTVGTPLTVAAEELRLECMFPADEETEKQHLAFMDEPPPDDLRRHARGAAAPDHP